MFELYQLRYFLAVVETGSFTKGSKRVRVSQPTLSAGIQKLEQTLAVQLFDRSSKRVFLTSAGTRFLEHAKAIVTQAQRAVSELQDVPAREVLSVGVLTTIAAAEVQRLFSDYLRAHPGTVLELYEGSERELNSRLSRELLQVALTIQRADNKSRSQSLYDEGYSLAVASRHPLSQRAGVQVSELADEPTIVRTRCELLSETSRFFTSHNVRPRLVYRTEQDERALQMVGAGVGITVMPDHFRAASVARVALAGFDERRTIALVRGRRKSTPLVNTFSEFAASQAWPAR